MHRRAFVLGLFGGLAAAAGLWSTPAPAEASATGRPVPLDPADQAPATDLSDVNAEYASHRGRPHYAARRRYLVRRRRMARRRYIARRRLYARRRYYARRRRHR